MEYSFDLERCIKCTNCLAVCPVRQVNPDFKGPKTLGPDYYRLRLGPDAGAQSCSNCKNCEVACPYNVPVTAYIQEQQELFYRQNRYRLRNLFFSNPNLTGMVGTSLAAIFNFFYRQEWVRKVAGCCGLNEELTLRFATKKYSQNTPQKKIYTKKVLYFTGCYANFYEPAIAEAAVSLLCKLGVEVKVVNRYCCGIPLLANGNLAKAKLAARQITALCRDYLNAGYELVTTCPSCSLAFKKEFGRVLSGADFLIYRDKVFDLGEYLEKEELLFNLNGRISIAQDLCYHYPCHLKAQGLGSPFARIVEDVTGKKVDFLPDQCCGLSGTYGLKKENKTIWKAMGEKLKENIAGSQAEQVLTECGSCSMQLRTVTEKPVIHPVILLDRLI